MVFGNRKTKIGNPACPVALEHHLMSKASAYSSINSNNNFYLIRLKKNYMK